MIVALLALAADVWAQEGGVCEAGRIASVGIESRSVFGDSDNGVMSKFYEAANWLHVDTRESVIRRELLFSEGACFERLRITESERLLRGFVFVRSAEVEATRRSNGDYDVEVTTQDEWSLRIVPRLELGSGPAVAGISVTEWNVAGTGNAIEFLYVSRPGRADVGGSYFNPQFLGSRWNAGLLAIRTEPGWVLRETLGYPFVGLVGRWAVFQDALYGERWFGYYVGDSKDRYELALPMTQVATQVGGALRVVAAPRGRATKLGSYGLTVSYERLSYGDAFPRDSATAAHFALSEEAIAALADLALRPREDIRLNLVVGIRGLDFIRRRGASTLRATEDIAIGATADLVLGLASSAFGSRDDHVLAGLDLYGGARVRGNWFSLLRANVEARRDYSERRWRDIFGALQWTNLWLLGPGRTVTLEGRWSAGWETTIPFQLTLGGPWGLAGFAAHRYPGGARAVVRLENRYFLGSIGRLMDLGFTAFVDGGQMWANKALFGVNSGLRGSAGLGLLIATPAGSRFAYRLQAALPIGSRSRLDDLVISLQIEGPLRLESAAVDPQLLRSRDIALPTAARHLK
ncbi:MAG: hypothetical protein GTO46_09330 [Gemmatimonadetes bacterium]|nr:hypothetical protein [Gemmatimonadota bacterium]NIO31817.1 hypothetical protein [Gemmatimonadota bacterium]